MEKRDNDAYLVTGNQKWRYSNNENSVKRWVWELCQNAKTGSQSRRNVMGDGIQQVGMISDLELMAGEMSRA